MAKLMACSHRAAGSVSACRTRSGRTCAGRSRIESPQQKLLTRAGVSLPLHKVLTIMPDFRGFPMRWTVALWVLCALACLALPLDAWADKVVLVAGGGTAVPAAPAHQARRCRPLSLDFGRGG